LPYLPRLAPGRVGIEVFVTRIVLQKWLTWIATGLSAVALLLVVANGALILTNQSRQTDIGQRQQFINQTAQLNQISDMLVRALAKQAIDNKDDKLLNLLAENGIGVAPTQAGATPSSPIPPARN
jgi:hypothetical protein